MHHRLYIVIIIIATGFATFVTGASFGQSLETVPATAAQFSPPASEPADIVLTTNGCAASSGFVLPATRAPQVRVRNEAAEAMVFTVPQLQRSVSVKPGQIATLDLPRYIMGTFASYCLSDREHAALGGNNPFLCVLQPEEIAPRALTTATFTIAPHNRIKELNKQPA